jgi:hypothetical protein
VLCNSYDVKGLGQIIRLPMFNIHCPTSYIRHLIILLHLLHMPSMDTIHNQPFIDKCLLKFRQQPLCETDLTQRFALAVSS